MSSLRVIIRQILSTLKIQEGPQKCFAIYFDIYFFGIELKLKVIGICFVADKYTEMSFIYFLTFYLVYSGYSYIFFMLSMGLRRIIL